MENVKALNSAIEITMSDMIAIPKDMLGEVVKKELGREIGNLISLGLNDLPVEFYSEGVNPCSGSETYRLRVWIHNKEYLESIEQRLNQTLCQNAKLHEELKIYKSDAELGRAARKAFGQSRGVLYIAPNYGVSPGRVIINEFDAQITCVETLLEWAKGVRANGK